VEQLRAALEGGRQVVRYRAALAAAGLSFRDGHLPWAAEDAAADLIFSSLECEALARALLDLHRQLRGEVDALLAPHLPLPPPAPKRRRSPRREKSGGRG
jgi:hypothetical protein